MPSKYTYANKVRVQKLFSFGMTELEVATETGFNIHFVCKVVKLSPWLTLTVFDKLNFNEWYDVCKFEIEQIDSSCYPFKLVFNENYSQFKKLKR